MTRNEAKQLLLDQYKIHNELNRLPMCKALSSEDGSKPYDIYIPIDVVLDAIMEAANK